MMKKIKGLAIAALLSTVSGAALAQEPLDIVFTVHSGASNTFWQAVQKGYEDACAKLAANCQMVYVQTDGSVQEQVANMEAALATDPDTSAKESRKMKAFQLHGGRCGEHAVAQQHPVRQTLRSP